MDRQVMKVGYVIIPNVARGLGLLCVLGSLAWMATSLTADKTGIEVHVDFGAAEIKDGLCNHPVSLTFRNTGSNKVRPVGFVPFCCSGKFGFAVTEAVDYPSQLSPGDAMQIQCAATYSVKPDEPARVLERIAGELLLDIDDELVSKPVTVSIRTWTAL